MATQGGSGVPLFLVGLLLGYAMESVATSGEIVQLTATERLGFARVAEPITIGVPLPQGTVKSTENLALVSAGKEIPAEVRPIVKWPDGSVRWVHLYFAGDCPAHGKMTVSLVERKPARLGRTIEVTDAVDAITVFTGPLRFVVKKKEFNLIDAAWINEKPVVAPHRRGGVVLVDKVEYWTSADPDVRVEVEERGPMHVVIKASGAHKNAVGEKKLDFVARIYAFHGSPIVRMTYTFIMAQGQRKDEFVPLAGLHLELPTMIKDAATTTFGSEAGPQSARLTAPAGEAFVLASNSDTITFGGAVSGSSKAKSSKPKNVGWASLSDGAKGVAAGVRWFWQMHPKSLELTGDGLVRVGLFPARAGKTVKIYSGVARTHYVQWVFHEATDGAKLASRFAGLESPLRPFASPRYYCRDAKAYGDVVEADPAQYKPEYRTLVEGWDKAFEANWKKFQKLMDGRQAGGARNDDYGMLEWGDNFHYTKKTSFGMMYEWNGNYYGYPHMMALQFIRTGKEEYFDTFDAHALHVADVHTVHYDPTGKLTGASRYCPPGEHVRIDKRPHYPVYISNTFNHFKSEELFERWYFTGDHRMLDVIAEHRRLVTEYKGADRSGGQPRGPGHLLITLAKFYEHTLDPIFLKRGKEVFDKNKDVVVQEKNGKANFQQGIQLEGARRYYEVSQDPDVIDYLKRWADFFQKTKTLQRTAAQAFGFLYGKTGDKQYLDLGLACIQRNTGDQHPDGQKGTGTEGLNFSKEKDFALTMRNGPYFFYYLSNAAPRPGK